MIRSFGAFGTTRNFGRHFIIEMLLPLPLACFLAALFGVWSRQALLPPHLPPSFPFAMSGNFGPGLIPKLPPDEKCSFVKFKDSGAFFAAATLAIKFEL